MAEKPSEGARDYARQVLEMILVGTNQKRLATDEEVDAVATDIDREAVAPAVRELVEALKQTRKVLVVACGETAPYIKQALANIDTTLEPYRHLLDGEGRK